jgi:hypothetical protein
MVTPELSQNIFVTFYLLFTHNYEAIVYLVGVIFAILLALYRPSRFATLILLGFAVLLFSFEYDKHIIEPLRNQTVASLITLTPHYKLRKMIDLVISVIVPVMLYVVGWASLFVAIFYAGLRINRKK